MKRLAILLTTLLLSVVSFGQSLSKQDLIDLKKAGLDKTVIIQQIQKDGISFEMNAATTIELKNLGFPDDVISALLSSTTSVTHAAAVQSDSAAALYRAGRFPELADRLKATLKANPTDYRAHALLITTLLKMKDKDAAHTEFQNLAAHGQDSTAVPYVRQVKTLLDTLQETEIAKGKLIAALKEYRVQDAYAAVDVLSASTMQKEILKIDVDMYQARFNEARDRFSKLQFTSFAEKNQSAKIAEHITEAEAAYKSVSSRIEFYLHSPYATPGCRFPITDYPNTLDAKLPTLSAKGYVELVSNLIRIAPASDESMNLAFHAQLLTGNYDELELLGDRLLNARGILKVPFYSAGSFFQLGVDGRKRRIYTEIDQHPFESVYKWKGRLRLVPFDVAFDEVTSISQKAGSNPHVKEVIAGNSYALKIEPGGIAPSYAVRDILFCSAGEKAELTVTRNLGQYLLHVIGNKGIKAELADPSKAKGPSSGWLSGFLIAGASMSSNPGLRDAAVQGLQADQAQQIANYQAQQAAWDSFTTQDTFNVVEADAFIGLEKLLGVLN